MNRKEYDAKREAGTNAGFTGIATFINDSLIKDEYIASLEARIAELDNELSALRTKWDELPAFLVKQDEADIFDEHNLNMLLIEYLLDIKPER